MRYFEFAGVRFSKINLTEAVRKLIDDVLQKRKTQVCVTNVYSLVMMQKDAEFRKINNSVELSVADGMPIVWLSRLMGCALPCRMAGADLFFELCKEASLRGFSIYLLGSTSDVLEKIKINLKTEFPNLQIAGMYSPPYKENFSEDENSEILRSINEAKPDILLVGMTAPKQEKWIYRNLDKLNVKVAIGIGAVFNFVAGTVKRAPRWMQKMGLEWLFRLIQEPKRLWKRYLIGNTIFIFLVIEELIKKIFNKFKLQLGQNCKKCI